MRIVNNPEPLEIDVKRFYPPFSVYDNCPTCGEEIMACGKGAYIMYPVVNKKEDLNFYCGPCSDADREPHEWEKSIVIRITAEEFTPLDTAD